MSLSVERMTAADVPAAVALLQGIEPQHDTTAWTERFGRDVDDPDRHPVVARAGGVVTGYARTLPYRPEPDDPRDHAPEGYYLLGLVVDAVARRQGIGSALTWYRLAWIAQRRDEAFFYTDASNVASQRMHERLGFERLADSFWFPALGRSTGEVLYRIALSPGWSQPVTSSA